MIVQSRYKFAKSLAKWAAVLSFLGITCYPIIIAPMIDSSEYKKIQEINRKGINQENIQPGNMRIWSNPFERR